MNTRIFVGGLLFIIMFIVLGYVLLAEGMLDVQAQDGSGRMQIYAASQKGLSIETGASIFDQYCDECHGIKGEGVPGKGPELNPYLFTTRFPEMKAANYGNTLENFVKLTVSAGRPNFSAYWTNAGFAENMPTWAKRYGGPLRDDQIQDVTNYILSWEAATKALPTIPPFDAVGADVTIELPEGDAARGEQLFKQQANLISGRPAPCAGCHSLTPGQGPTTGPALEGIGARAGSTVSGQDAATYIRHSIQAPSEYLVPGETYVTADGKSVMPGTLGDSMDAQDLADLIAYLLTLQ
jgi:mono/diheme cytochrome c family protein